MRISPITCGVACSCIILTIIVLFFQELEKASEAYGRDQGAWLVKGNESENDSEKSGVLSDDAEKLTSNIETLRHRLSLALQNGEDARSAEKSKRDMVQDLQARMGKSSPHSTAVTMKGFTLYHGM